MIISDHIMRVQARERVAALRGAAAPGPAPSTSGKRRSSRSRRRGAYRAHILGLRGTVK